MVQTLIRWKLKEIMARYNIKGVDLAKKLDISTNAMSSLRRAKTMPRFDGISFNLLCNALNELAQDLDTTITPGDLLDYQLDPTYSSQEGDKVYSVIKRRRARRNKNNSDEADEMLSQQKAK